MTRENTEGDNITSVAVQNIRDYFTCWMDLFIKSMKYQDNFASSKTIQDLENVGMLDSFQLCMMWVILNI